MVAQEPTALVRAGRREALQLPVPARRARTLSVTFTDKERAFHDTVTEYVKAEASRRAQTPLPLHGS